MNSILVIIDTLRYDYVGANGNAGIETPNLDRLAAEAWVFDHCYISSFPTIPHRTDVITGDYGSPFHEWMPLPFDVPTLPDVLKRQGYATQLIHDTPHLVNGGHHFDYPFNSWTFVRGAEVDRPWIMDTLPVPDNWARDPLFDEQPDAPPPPDFPGRAYNPTDVYLPANRTRKKYEDWNCARLFTTAREFLHDNAQRRNFFLWLDCFDPHEPWDAPPEFVLKYDKTPGYDGRVDPRTFGSWRNSDLTDAARERIRATYAAKVTWMDHWFGVLLDALEETGLKNETALIVTSDHGTNDGRFGSFGKTRPPREGEARVPLMVRAPGIGVGRSDAIVQPQDFLATLVTMAGGDPPLALDSHDVIAQADGTAPHARQIALAGSPLWERELMFTAFDGEWCLEVAAKPEKCRLVRLGESEDVSSSHSRVVAELREQALDECERRKADPAIVDWMRREGTQPYPANAIPHRFFPPPPGYKPYFGRVYHGDMGVSRHK
jgi:arylsulfatase A-like enzyme